MEIDRQLEYENLLALRDRQTSYEWRLPLMALGLSSAEMNGVASGNLEGDIKSFIGSRRNLLPQNPMLSSLETYPLVLPPNINSFFNRVRQMG